MKIIFTKGVQASSKSTWAKQFVKENQNYKRVCRDDIRHMLNGYVFNKENETSVTIIEREIIKIIILQGKNLIIDKMNLNQKDFESDVKFIKEVMQDDSVQIEVKEFPITLNEALERDKKRDNPIGEKVIKATWHRYENELINMIKRKTLVEYDDSLPNCIIVDVDGTLAIRVNRSPFDFSKVCEDEINKPVKALVQLLSIGEYEEPTSVIIFSGRDDSCIEDTKMWLIDHVVHFYDIFMRKTGDKRKDSIVKKEMYEEHIKGKYNVLYVVDDRKQVVDMWREIGLTCLDVAGNNF